MRGIRSTWLTTLVVTTVVGTLGLGATARAGTARPVNRGYQHLLQVEAARDAAMAARGARPGSALPTHGGVAGPATLGTVRDVEQISEDTLHQGEKDTQVEPDIAMDPNNANSVVAVTQQGRPGSGLLVVTDGTVLVERPAKEGVELGPGEFLGELALLTPEGLHTARVRAKTAAVLLAIGRTEFTRLIEAEPKIALALVSSLAARLAATTQRA